MSSDKKRVVFPILALAGLIGVAYALTQSKPSASVGKKNQPALLAVDVLTVTEERFIFAVDSYGILKAKTQTDLLPLVGGRLAFVSGAFKAGARFKKGERLLQVEQVDYVVALQVAKGDVATAELALAEEQARHEQAKRDWNKQAEQSAATDLALRLPQLKSAQAALDTAIAQLTLAELNLERTEIRAPYDGRVLQTHVDVGSVISQNTLLATLYSDDAVEVRLPINNQDLAFVALPEGNVEDSAPIEVSIRNTLFPADARWEGRVLRTEAAVDANSQQLFVVAQIDAPFTEASLAGRQPLKIGQYVNAVIEGKAMPDAIVIPNETIYQGSYVYTVNEGLLQRTDIEILWRNDLVSIVSSGLVVGDQLVTTLLGQVISGTAVEVVAPSSESAL